MLDLEALRKAVRSLPRSDFARSHPGFYLVKRPRNTKSEQPQKATFSYATVAGKTDIDPFAAEWQIFAVAKRPGNPFPERVTIGRAPNCDISLRVPFISKAHAHIVLAADGSFSLRDNQGANGTFHNNRRLEAGEQPVIKVGDTVQFNSITFEFADGLRLYDILLTELKTVSAPPR